MDAHRMRAQHGRLRRVVAGLAIGMAAAAFAPAGAGAAGLVAAFDRYEAGKGFEIGLVNVSTGAAVPVPAGVNTTADELHPTLSADGRFLVFTRMTLQPKLNGDIVPPAQRALRWVDRQTGQITAFRDGGAGPVFTSKTASSSTLAWGITPAVGGPVAFEGSVNVAQFVGLGANPPSGTPGNVFATVPVEKLHIPHAATIPVLLSQPVSPSPGCSPCTAPRAGRYLSLAYVDPNTGALEKSVARLSLFGQQASLSSQPSAFNVLEFGAPGSPGSHPVPRSGDGYVALDLASGTNVDIQTITYPGETQVTPAPAPITTLEPERMPAWSPDGVQLGFVRTKGAQRNLVVFDATPGIQNALNPPIALGPDAPTPQIRAFESTWGGLSLALSSSLDGGGSGGGVPTVTCATNCLVPLTNSTILHPVPLLPKLSSTSKGQSVGIFVARVTGTRKLLGRKVPRIRVVGRVPLGATVKGVNRFRWNGKVNGRRLAAGTYLLTYRALKKGRVLSTSGSIRLTVTRSGKIVGVRRQL